MMNKQLYFVDIINSSDEISHSRDFSMWQDETCRLTIQNLCEQFNIKFNDYQMLVDLIRNKQNTKNLYDKIQHIIDNLIKEQDN